MGNKFSNKTMVNLRPKVCKSPPPPPHPTTIPITTCVNWNPAPRQVQVILAGVTNGSCTNCAVNNRTWILTYVSACQWNQGGPAGSGPCLSTPWGMSMVLASGFVTVTIVLNPIEDTVFRKTGYPSSPTAPFVVTRLGTPVRCTNFPTTLTVTPL